MSTKDSSAEILFGLCSFCGKDYEFSANRLMQSWPCPHCNQHIAMAPKNEPIVWPTRMAPVGTRNSAIIPPIPTITAIPASITPPKVPTARPQREFCGVCGFCSNEFFFTEQLIGEAHECPNCQKIIKMEVASEKVTDQVASEMTENQPNRLKGECNLCRANYEFPESIKGQTHPCPACKVSIKMEPSALIATGWLSFWIYVRLPLGVLLGLGGVFSGTFNEVNWMVLAIVICQLSIGIGLHFRKFWAWEFNIFYIGFESLFYAYQGAVNTKLTGGRFLFAFTFSAIILLAIWAYPNYVYFKKRKFLFCEKATID